MAHAQIGARLPRAQLRLGHVVLKDWDYTCMYVCMYVHMYVCTVICILSYKVKVQARFSLILAFHLQHGDAHQSPCPELVASL